MQQRAAKRWCERLAAHITDTPMSSKELAQVFGTTQQYMTRVLTDLCIKRHIHIAEWRVVRSQKERFFKMGDCKDSIFVPSRMIKLPKKRRIETKDGGVL